MTMFEQAQRTTSIRTWRKPTDEGFEVVVAPADILPIELTPADALALYHQLGDILMKPEVNPGDVVDVYGWAARCAVRARIVAISRLTGEVKVTNGGGFHFTQRANVVLLPADTTCDIWFGSPESDGAGGERQCKRPAAHPHDALSGARGNHAATPLPQDAPS